MKLKKNKTEAYKMLFVQMKKFDTLCKIDYSVEDDILEAWNNKLLIHDQTAEIIRNIFPTDKEWLFFKDRCGFPSPVSPTFEEKKDILLHGCHDELSNLIKIIEALDDYQDL